MIFDYFRVHKHAINDYKHIIIKTYVNNFDFDIKQNFTIFGSSICHFCVVYASFMINKVLNINKN